MSLGAYREAVGAATITATYVRHGKKWRVLIRPVNAARITRVVPTEQDAKDLARHFNRLGMAGVDLGLALAEARRETHEAYPPLRTALPAFLDEQVTLRNLRESTARSYKNRLATWAYPRNRRHAVEPAHAGGGRRRPPRDPQGREVDGQRGTGPLPAHPVLPVADQRAPLPGGQSGG